MSLGDLGEGFEDGLEKNRSGGSGLRVEGSGVPERDGSDAGSPATDSGLVEGSGVSPLLPPAEQREILCPVCSEPVAEWISASGFVHCKVPGRGWRKHPAHAGLGDGRGDE